MEQPSVEDTVTSRFTANITGTPSAPVTTGATTSALTNEEANLYQTAVVDNLITQQQRLSAVLNNENGTVSSPQPQVSWSDPQIHLS